MSGPTDGTLLVQTIEGDRSGFLRLVDRYAPSIVAVIQHRLGHNSQAVETVVVEVFRQAFLELRRVQDPEIFFRKLFDLAREKASQRTQASPPPSDPAPARTDEEELLLSQVVRWKYLEGESYEQIARKLGLAPDRLDLLIQRGRIRSRWSHCGHEAMA